jgi:hypothetical protein
MGVIGEPDWRKVRARWATIEITNTKQPTKIREKIIQCTGNQRNDITNTKPEKKTREKISSALEINGTTSLTQTPKKNPPEKIVRK